jgi:hypothetical protein
LRIDEADVEELAQVNGLASLTLATFEVFSMAALPAGIRIALATD